MEYSIAEYRRAYVEVLATIAEFSNESRAKIPEDRIAHMEAEKDPDYHFEYRRDIRMEDQISELACGLIANIYYNYLASPAEREMLDIRKAARRQ